MLMSKFCLNELILLKILFYSGPNAGLAASTIGSFRLLHILEKISAAILITTLNPIPA